MKKVLICIVLSFVCNAFLSGEVIENQDYIQGPRSEKWYLYIDFDMSLFDDLNLKKYSIENASNPAPFQVSNSTDIQWRNNSFMFGFNYNLRTDETDGNIDLYFGLGQAATQVSLFPTGTIGLRGWTFEAGLEGDLFKFGRSLQNSIKYDGSLTGILSKGAKSGAVDQDYDLINISFNLRVTYNVNAYLADTTSAQAYIGGEFIYQWGRLNLENSGSVTGTGIYDLENRFANQVYGIIGTKMFWEKDRTTVDIYLAGSVDRSYLVGMKIIQNF